MLAGAMSAYAVSAAAIEYFYSDQDDLYSIRRHLVRHVSPSLAAGADEPGPGEANLYVEPIIGTFSRPAVTVTLANTAPKTPWPARDPSSFVTQQVAVRVYDYTREGTMALTDKVMRALGAYGGDGLRIPLWAFWTPPSVGGAPTYPIEAFRLARMLRVERGSLSPSLEEQDDDRLWQRTVQARMLSPRNRDMPAVSRLRLVTSRLNGLPGP